MSKIIIKNIKHIYLIVLITASIFAQKPQYKFSSIEQSDGLVHGTIYSMVEDSFGFMWIGTQQGMQRYDGVSFKTFEASENDSVDLWYNFVMSFYEDKNNDIWIATPGGLNRYDRKTERIYKVELAGEERINVAYGIIGDKNNDDIIWIVGVNLIKYNISTGEFNKFEIGNFHEERDKPFTILVWLLHHPLDSKKILFGADQLYAFDTETYTFETLLKLDQTEEIPNYLINDAVIDPDNNDIIWMATGDLWGRGSKGGLIQYDLRKKRESYFTPENRPNEVLGKHLLKLCFDHSGNLWIGTRYNGVLLYNKKGDRFYNYIKKKDDPESFGGNNSVISIATDRSNSMWFGTWGDGIVFLSPLSQKFTHYKYIPNNDNGLQDATINTFAEDKDGNIWIGTNEGGLSKYYPRTGKFENYYKEFISDTDPIGIIYLYYDSKDNLWIGTYQDALHRFNPATGAKVHYEKGTGNKNVTQNRISSIVELKQGEIIITTYGGGVNIYSYATDSFKHFLHNPNDSTSILDNQIWLPFEADDGKYYMSGNSRASLISFDPETEIFENLTSKLAISTFMQPMKNASGNFYINDVSVGLRELKISDSLKIENIIDVNGDQVSDYEGMQIDSEENLWLGTHKGLHKFNPKTKVVKEYDIEDGIQSYVFNRYSSFKASTGQMYFGGINGFNAFYPNEIKLSDYKPNIVFVGLKLFQDNVEIGENAILNKSITLLDQIELAYDQNDFTIEFAAIDFSDPNRVQYKYILENHDDEWIDAGHKNYVSYTNMDPGEYTLKVLATNSDGIWVDQPKSLAITITPPIWMTTYAYIFYLLVFAGGIFTIDRIQRRRLLAKAKVAAQIREAELRAQLAEKENERKSHELEEARNLQLSMLPKVIPQLPNLNIAVYMKTATEVGGDYYDFHVHLDGTLTVVLGDATGHGLRAGTMVTSIKSLFSSLSNQNDILKTFHEMTRCIKQMHFDKLLMSFTMLKISGNKLKMSAGGMPPVYIYHEKNNSVEEYEFKGMPLGSIENFPYEVKELELSSGDTILLTSDGFPELSNSNKDQYGYRKL